MALFVLLSAAVCASAFSSDLTDGNSGGGGFGGSGDAFGVSGNEVDYLFRFTTSTGDSALKLPANGIAIGYLSFSIVFLLFALYSKPSAAGESESADGH